MAKLEELSELLVSEIRDFGETVKRLEDIQKKKIQLDISELQRTFDKHDKNFSTSISEIENQLNQMNLTIGKAKIYLKWAVVIFISSLLLNIVILVLFIFKI